MFIFGHLGITLGIFFILGQLIPSIRDRLDYRVIALGALLPDLIDKPIGRFLFAESVASGRLVGHTLVFVLILLIGGYVLLNRRGDGGRGVQVAGAGFLHLVEDRMWMSPVTLLWPAMGWRFPQGDVYGSFMDYLLDVVSHCYIPEPSYVFVSEVVGLFVLVGMLVRYVRRRRDVHVVKYI